MHFIQEWFVALFKGAGQVMFQPSAVAGVIMLSGVLVGCLSVGGSGNHLAFSGALVALIIATFCAKVCRTGGWTDGLCGFNAVLIGCATFTFLGNSASAWIMLVAASLLSVAVKPLLDRLLRCSSYTLPFVLCTWAVLACGISADLCVPAEPENVAEITRLSASGLLTGVLKGISEIYLIDSWVTGLIFIAALAVVNLKAALWAIAGSAGGLLLALAACCPVAEITAGLWGFSPALTAIAVGTVLPCKRLRGVLVAVSVALTFAIQYISAPLFAQMSLPVLTMPFCLATILTGYALQLINRAHCS